MLVGVAPPYVDGIKTKTVAESATNDPDDNLRTFILDTLGGSWDILLERGLYFIHAVKCAITPEDRHQNPPDDVIDVCAAPHFAEEILLIRPSAVVVFGKAPFRALLRVPGVRSSMPPGLGLSCSVARLVEKTQEGITISANGWHFQLFGSSFPLLALRSFRKQPGMQE